MADFHKSSFSYLFGKVKWSCLLNFWAEFIVFGSKICLFFTANLPKQKKKRKTLQFSPSFRKVRFLLILQIYELHLWTFPILQSLINVFVQKPSQRRLSDGFHFLSDIWKNCYEISEKQIDQDTKCYKILDIVHFVVF